MDRGTPGCYLGTMVSQNNKTKVERVQTGVRMEKRLVKVLKGLAEYKDITLGDLLEGICLHAFEGQPAFGAETLAKIADFKGIYELDLDATHSHLLEE
ncbi:MAG: hypothetical protein V3W41_12235 [Planctomycetota bacterium]